jgi:hypothetical protein
MGDQRVNTEPSAWDDIEYVRKNPEFRPAFLNSMVRAGLLEELLVGGNGSGRPLYRPSAILHAHDWIVYSSNAEESDQCLIACRSCTSSLFVPNSLPIKVPDG